MRKEMNHPLDRGVGGRNPKPEKVEVRVAGVGTLATRSECPW